MGIKLQSGESRESGAGVFPPCVAVIDDIGEDIFLVTAPIGKSGVR